MSAPPVLPSRRPGRASASFSILSPALLLPLIALAVPPIQFRTPPSFPVGDGPWQIVSADFNRDGAPDLATANFDDSTVSVLLAQNGGTFAAAVHFPVGAHPDSLAVGDFNGDGQSDLVTANGNGWNQPGTMSLLLGRGDGNFEPAAHLTVGRGPRGVAVADFNGDTQPDVAVAISGGWFETNQVNVLLGHGDGTFDPPASFTVGTAPAWIAAGDFNADNRPDLVVVNAGPAPDGTTASVLLNDGSGGFAAAVNYTVGTYPGFVLVADFNADNKPDFATANRASGSISVLTGRGDGTFNAASHFPVQSGVSQLTAGDFNRDGHPDLAALGGSYESGAVSLLLGNGAGSFTAPASLSIGAALQAMAAGDFTGDTKLDLIVAGGYDNTALLMVGNGDGTFKNTTDTFEVGGDIHGMITGDFSRDGQLDIAIASLESNLVSVLIQQTNDVFRPAVNYPVGSQPYSVKSGDFNNDGALDLVTANFDGTLTLLRGRTTAPGVFTNNWTPLTKGGSHTDVAVGHLNGGTHLDLVTPNYYSASLNVILGNGDGTFRDAAPPTVAVNGGPVAVLIEDFDRDGKPDVAVGYEGGMKISILYGRGDGTFEPKTDINTWEIPWSIAVADFNFDGRPDLVAGHYDWRRVSVMMNLGGRAFAAPATHEVANDPVTVVVGDFNGDNLPDVASANFASVSVLLGLGDGTFLTAVDYFVGGHYAAVGDFNRDGMPDIALDLGGKVGLFWNDTLPRLQIQRVAGGVRVAWPAWKFYALEVNTNLLDAGAWQAVTNTPATYTNQFVLTNALQGANQAYRLKRP